MTASLHAYQAATKGKKLNTAAVERHLYAITTDQSEDAISALEHRGPLGSQKCYSCGSTQHLRRTCPKLADSNQESFRGQEGRGRGRRGTSPRGRNGSRGNDRACKLLSHLADCLRKDLAPPKGKAAINCCLLYTSPSPRDRQKSRMPSSA